MCVPTCLSNVWYSGHGLNNGPFNDRTDFEHLNTKLVRYSDPRCIATFYYILFLQQFQKGKLGTLTLFKVNIQLPDIFYGLDTGFFYVLCYYTWLNIDRVRKKSIR